jgi:hypothetical protein
MCMYPMMLGASLKVESVYPVCSVHYHEKFCLFYAFQVKLLCAFHGFTMLSDIPDDVFEKNHTRLVEVFIDWKKW